MAIDPKSLECPEAACGGAEPLRAQQKRAQLLDGACDVFLDQGYGGASVDDIARRAGISKATLYRYYPDKAALFDAFVTRECSKQADMLLRIEPCRKPIRDFLCELGEGYIRFILSPFAQGIYRIAVAESERLPDVGRVFYESGPARICRQLSPILAFAAQHGQLALDDPELVAHQFFELCRAEIFYKSLFGIGRPADDEEVRRRASLATRVILDAYAPR